MTNPPLIIYPCLFDIKIMGVNSPQLIPEVTAIISSFCENFNPNENIQTKISAKGNYLSITAKVLAKSKEQLDNIYLALNKHELVKVTL